MKLTKNQIKLHDQATKLLEKETLTFDDKWFVLENWQESANHVNGKAGAYFTPPYFARDFSIDCYQRGKIVDICAGIGALSFALLNKIDWDNNRPEITCIEINPAYVEVGKKILPEANWVCADIFEVWQDLGQFDSAISNPPFGRISGAGKAPSYIGAEFEYKIIDIASHISKYGTFIIPQNSAPFRFSGVQCFEEYKTNKYERFFDQTSLLLEPGCGIDTTYYRDDWHGVAPICEVVCCDFLESLSENQQNHNFAQSLNEPEQMALF